MRYTLLSFLCFITVIAYVQRTAMNGATKVIEADLGISSTQLGYVMSAWYLAYSLGQLPTGWVADRLGSKPALLLFAAVWSVLTGLAGLAGILGGLPALILMWGCMGGIQAGIFPCCTKAIGATFPKTEQAIASGSLACCMSLGAALAPLLTSQLLGPLSWQQIFALYAIPGLVWAVLFAVTVPRPDSPAVRPAPVEDEKDDWHALPPVAGTSTAPATPARWTKLVTDPQMLLLCFQQFLRAGAMVFFYTWFARFLQETKGLSAQEAGALASWPPFVGAFGGLLGGLFSDYLLRRTGNSRLARQGMSFVALCVCTGCAATAYFVDDSEVAVALISVGAFCGMASGVSAYALAISYGGKRVATVFATMNMSGNLGAALFPIVVGWMGDHGYWSLVLLLFVAMFGTAAVCWVVLNPRGTLFDEAVESEKEEAK
jgi:sugar phosphate permease